MNGLGLRINRGGGGKSKNSIAFSPIQIPHTLFENAAESNEEIQAFKESTSTDDQLQPFSDELASQVLSHISENPSDYKQCVDTVGKLMLSIENFPPGVVALRSVDVTLAEYLKHCLQCCVTTLREQNTLSPTEKNEIFNLCHLTLRLLLHSIQKSTDDSLSKLILIFDDIRLNIHELMYDDDVPMDTKSVGGILYLTMHVTEKGTDSWIQVVNSSSASSDLSKLMELEAGRLSLYSAVPTVVLADQLLTRSADDGVAILVLTDRILEIGESSSESAIILGVARTLLQISKLLLQLPNSHESGDKRDSDDSGDNVVGLSLVESLLRFAWGHLEHHMDSVRHLTAQMLGAVVKYCAYMDAKGSDSAALSALCTAMSRLDRGRKSYYVCAWSAALQLAPAALLALLPPQGLVAALRDSALRNTASTALEAMLDKLCSECDTALISTELVQPCLLAARTSEDAGELAVLEKLLVRACTKREQLLQDLLSYIKSARAAASAQELKCVLMLVRVARGLGAAGAEPRDTGAEPHTWRGLISYDLLKWAAVDAMDETRILSLSVVSQCPRSTEPLRAGELQHVLYFLRYNCNVQQPNFRQLILSNMIKVIKRLEDSYKVLRRQMHVEGVSAEVGNYLQFAEDLRRQCFASLVPGANYSRRFVALQVLAWCEQISLEGYHKSWEAEYVEKLLLHLEDSYENNKGLALDVLASCPKELLMRKDYSISLDLEDIIHQASSLKPTDCVSAGYKLELLRTRLPGAILQGEHSACAVIFHLTRVLLCRARAQLTECARSIVRGAARAPMYGLLHCIKAVLVKVDPEAISQDEQWTALIAEIIGTCMEVNAAVACVVNNSSPEGHLPMDMTVQISDHGNSGNVTLEDGRQVTAQMVLLCAWRSVKEVSLLLGEICARLTIREECASGAGSVSAEQLRTVGEHYTALLGDTQHRGAFEQAYVGFTMLLDRLWRCRAAALHGLPRRWLQRLLGSIAAATTPPTRRSAGIPFIIQEHDAWLHHVLRQLLRLVSDPACPAGRTHALHVLRALVRHAALGARAAPLLQDVLCAALRAFDARSWPERNSSTLLLSALVQRVFGVQRTTMTGRIFFLRYPQVYDFMLEKLQEASSAADSTVVRPSLYPVLLLLARLYPSSLEGTVSNLKLVAFVPHVMSCAGSSVLKTRQLAAKAIVPLISPDMYIPHLESTLELVQHEHTKANQLHGLLLQLGRLLQAGARAGGLAHWHWAPRLRPALRHLRGSCYPVADELIKVINLLVLRLLKLAGIHDQQVLGLP
ncbi:hypothetical protein SFRURICE_000933 [Spodoptera frugiperda]|nr:hypothetical protein SFRURICE_000933 [Spodoptera frugiperda]